VNPASLTVVDIAGETTRWCGSKGKLTPILSSNSRSPNAATLGRSLGGCRSDVRVDNFHKGRISSNRIRSSITRLAAHSWWLSISKIHGCKSDRSHPYAGPVEFSGGVTRNEPVKVSLCASGSFSGIRKPNSPTLLKIP